MRIEGSPAVPNDTEITCGEKARLQTNRNSDGTISALYTYPKSVTLYGNGGKYNGEETITVDYPDKGSLDLGQYAETVTLAWANADWSKGIMPFVPGAAITNAVFDTLHGDYLSGLARAAEAFVIALAVAIGIGMGLFVMAVVLGR